MQKLVKNTFFDTDLQKEYKKLRNELTHRTNKAKQSHYHKLLDNSKNDIHQTWNVIAYITNKSKKNKLLTVKKICSGLLKSIHHVGCCLNETKVRKWEKSVDFFFILTLFV